MASSKPRVQFSLPPHKHFPNPLSSQNPNDFGSGKTNKERNEFDLALGIFPAQHLDGDKTAFPLVTDNLMGEEGGKNAPPQMICMDQPQKGAVRPVCWGGGEIQCNVHLKAKFTDLHSWKQPSFEIGTLLNFAMRNYPPACTKRHLLRKVCI